MDRARISLPLLLLAASMPALAQAGSGTASVPAGALPAPSATPPVAYAPRPTISTRQAREADDAYLKGARELEHGDLVAAEHSLTQAVQLNPNNRDYALAAIVVREHLVQDLVAHAAEAHRAGDEARRASLLAQAHALDPDDSVIAQHFPAAGPTPTVEALAAEAPGLPAQDLASSLGGPIEFAPKAGTQSFHLRGDAQILLRAVYSAFGISTTFDTSVTPGPSMRLDVDNVDFATASTILEKLTTTFAVPVQPTQALLARDTPDLRNSLAPQVEETIYLPGLTDERIKELANVARDVFELKQVTASATGGTILARGDERVLRVANATFADMVHGGSDILFDVNLYEVDKTHLVNIGAQLPASAGVFSVAAEAQTLVSANQSVINQAIAAGLIKLSGNSLTDLITEVVFLIASGTVSAAQYTNLLGIFGNGLSLAGLYLGSSSSFNLLLNSSDVRILDAVKLRAGDRQVATFRAGSRYPILTAIYNNPVTSSLASTLAGLNINGTSVASLLAQYNSTAAATAPQFQFEDLGVTLKITPQILHGGDVNMKLELKLESLAGSNINTIPVLNNRSLTSTVTVPAGQTAMMASLVSNTELHALQGLPGLGELPGFVGTDKSVEKDTTELLITVTPHIVGAQPLRVAGRRIPVIRISEIDR